MKKWFRGKGRQLDCVDFQTKTTYYEVKSCRILVGCTHWKRNKGPERQLGRFKVERINHELLKHYADKDEKRIRYIFVLAIGNQYVWKTVTWEHVDGLLRKDHDETKIKIKDIFEVN